MGKTGKNHPLVIAIGLGAAVLGASAAAWSALHQPETKILNVLSPTTLIVSPPHVTTRDGLSQEGSTTDSAGIASGFGRTTHTDAPEPLVIAPPPIADMRDVGKTAEDGRFITIEVTKRVLPRRSLVIARPVSEICESTAKVGDRLQLQLLEPLRLSDASTIAESTLVTGRVTKRLSNPGQPMLLELEATELIVDSTPIGLETNSNSFYLLRPKSAGRMVKGAVIGAVAGAVIGLVLKQNPAMFAAGGAALGGGVGRVTGDKEVCLSGPESRFAFTTVSDVPVPRK